MEVAFPHELGYDVHGLIQRADGVQLDQLLVPQALQVLDLLGEVLCLHVGWGGKAGAAIMSHFLTQTLGAQHH